MRLVPFLTWVAVVALLPEAALAASTSSVAAPSSPSSVGAVCPVEPSSAEASPTSSDGAAGAGGGGGSNTNPVVQLGKYVKDQFVRMKDGSVALYSNHKTCNAIRAKQKEFLLASLPPPSDGKPQRVGRIPPTTGGITYDEFVFLQKGKDDRGRVGNLAFMMFFAPNFLPYAIMFNPNMLPSTFQMDSSEGGGGGGMGMGMGLGSKKGGHGESRWQSVSRERSHAVLRAMLDLERSARVPSGLFTKVNPFGKGKARREMDRLGSMGRTAADLLAGAAGGGSGADGADAVLDALDDELYARGDDPPSKGRLNVASDVVPPPIMMGLARALEAGKSPPPSFYPNFMVRGQVLNALGRISDADEFLVNYVGRDLAELDRDALVEACSDRLMGCCAPHHTEEEMREGLRRWLDGAVRRPRARLEAAAVGAEDVTPLEGSEEGKKPKPPALYYNANLGRTALLCYYAADAARGDDDRSSTGGYLPRALFRLPPSQSSSAPSMASAVAASQKAAASESGEGSEGDGGGNDDDKKKSGRRWGRGGGGAKK